MGGIITVCTLLGQFIDKRMALSTPWFTVFLSLFGVLGALFSTLKQLLKDS
jgi:F0F1-type ATP synthase assembly protein I